eukprot:208114-Chlamydomonas_euryale.AAC.2
MDMPIRREDRACHPHPTLYPHTCGRIASCSNTRPYSADRICSSSRPTPHFYPHTCGRIASCANMRPYSADRACTSSRLLWL